MSPRATVTAVAGFLVVLLSAFAALLPVPYVRMAPGRTQDTLGTAGGRPLIEIDGRRTYATSGQLRLTTVSVSGGPNGDVSLVSALEGWLDRDVAVVPVEQIYSEDETPEQVEQRNSEEMQVSQENAKAAALRHLRIPVDSTVAVASIVEGSPALGRLKAGDRIERVDGRPVATPDDVRKAITSHRAGETVRLVVDRAGTRREVEVRTRAAPEDGRAVIGIAPQESFDLPFDVDVSLEDVGGPSAGLMFALAIVDKLTPGALTGGRVVAGTGTITPDGEVGPIGGIQQKIAAARDERAAVFLVPSANCDEAVLASPGDVRLVRVRTLADAAGALERLAAGKRNLPRCPA